MADAKLVSIDGVGATGAGTSVRIRVPSGKDNVPVVIRGITTATVKVEGSLDGTNWVELASKSADFAGVVPAFPYLRGNITAWTEGDITVEFYADKAFGS